VLLVAFLVTVIVTDWKWRRIPNVVTYPAILAGVALSAFAGVGAVGSGGVLDHVAAVVLAFLFSYPLYAAGGLKAGDAKLLMTIGALRGTTFLLGAAVYGALLGGLAAVALIVWKLLARPGAGQRRPALRDVLKSWMPYGVALGAGGLVALVADVARS
jgi:prepilin peptidase CpaA